MKEFSQQKDKLEAEVSTLEENERRYSAALDAKKTEFQTMTGQKQQLDSEYSQYCAWKASYEAQQKKREAERKERQTLFSLHKEMEAEWSAMKGRLERLQKEEARSEKEVQENESKIALLIIESNLETMRLS